MDWSASLLLLLFLLVINSFSEDVNKQTKCIPYDIAGVCATNIECICDEHDTTKTLDFSKCNKTFGSLNNHLIIIHCLFLEEVILPPEEANYFGAISIYGNPKLNLQHNFTNVIAKRRVESGSCAPWLDKNNSITPVRSLRIFSYCPVWNGDLLITRDTDMKPLPRKLKSLGTIKGCIINVVPLEHEVKELIWNTKFNDECNLDYNIKPINLSTAIKCPIEFVKKGECRIDRAFRGYTSPLMDQGSKLSNLQYFVKLSKDNNNSVSMDFDTLENVTLYIAGNGEIEMKNLKTINRVVLIVQGRIQFNLRPITKALLPPLEFEERPTAPPPAEPEICIENYYTLGFLLLFIVLLFVYPHIVQGCEKCCRKRKHTNTAVVESSMESMNQATMEIKSM